MSDWHFGMDYDMWLYPPVDWTAPDYDYELPEPIEAANIEGELLVNAEDAIEQVRRLQRENAKLRELVRNFLYEHEDYFAEGNYFIGDIDLEHAMQHNHAVFRREAYELGVEVDW